MQTSAKQQKINTHISKQGPDQKINTHISQDGPDQELAQAIQHAAVLETKSRHTLQWLFIC